MTHRLAIDDVANLPAMLTTREAAELLGVGVDHLWALAREGTAPVQPVKLGRILRWPTGTLLALAGLDGPSPPPSTRNEASCSTAEASSIPFATPDRQVRSRRG
jgi:excisionase family DNA binding protein